MRTTGAAAAGLGALGLAGCENTTTPIGTQDAAAASGEVAKFVVPKPTGPGGLPLPRTDNSVTWAITDDNQPIDDGLKSELGPLKIYNYPDYIDPGVVKKFKRETGVDVQIATYNSNDEALAKLGSGAVSFDLVMGLSGSNIDNLIAQQLIKPLNYSYLTNIDNMWPELRDPFYDRGGRYTAAYVVWLDGIGWRNDKVSEDIAAMDVPWDIFWESQKYRGLVGILDDRRDALSMPMQRDAMKTGARPDLNTEDAALIEKAQRDLSALGPICQPKVAITDYQTLPEGKTVLHQSWSGDLLSAAFFYLPKDVPATALSFWGPATNGVVQNDFFCVCKKAKSPVLAHRFINFILDEKNAYTNFLFNGYTPPQNGIDAAGLVKRGVIPRTLESALVRPDQFAGNQQLLQLSVEGERSWDKAWSQFKAG